MPGKKHIRIRYVDIGVAVIRKNDAQYTQIWTLQQAQIIADTRFLGTEILLFFFCKYVNLARQQWLQNAFS